MAVRPYWWCPECETTHDSSVAACVNCGRAGLAKKSMKVPSIEATAPAPKPPWTAYAPQEMRRPAVGRLSREDTRELQAVAIRRAVEGGPGIAALPLKVPPRAKPPRHETKAWDPYGVTLPDAETGRYGWLP